MTEPHTHIWTERLTKRIFRWCDVDGCSYVERRRGDAWIEAQKDWNDRIAELKAPGIVIVEKPSPTQKDQKTRQLTLF